METSEIIEHFFSYGSDSFIRDAVFRRISSFTLENLHLILAIDRNLANCELTDLTFVDVFDKFNNKMRSTSDNITIIFLICYKLDLMAKKTYNIHGYESFNEDLQNRMVRQLNLVQRLGKIDWGIYLVSPTSERINLFEFISYGCCLFTAQNILLNVLNRIN
jgi:hypothetical protein